MLKKILFTVTISFLPSLALAYNCSTSSQQAASCAEGMIWDADMSSCVEQISS